MDKEKEKKPMSTGKKFGLGCLGLIVLFIIIGVAASAGKKDSNSQTVPNASNSTNTTTSTQPAKTASETITISNSSAKSSGYGTWEVVGEAKNNDSVKHSAMLKATFYASDGSIMGTAVGAVNGIESGGTKTFNLMSTDSVSGYKDMKVQVDTLL